MVWAPVVLDIDAYGEDTDCSGVAFQRGQGDVRGRYLSAVPSRILPMASIHDIAEARDKTKAINYSQKASRDNILWCGKGKKSTCCLHSNYTEATPVPAALARR